MDIERLFVNNNSNGKINRITTVTNDAKLYVEKFTVIKKKKKTKNLIIYPAKLTSTSKASNPLPSRKYFSQY